MNLTVSKAVARRIGLEGTKLSSADATCNRRRFTAKLKPNAKAEHALEDYRGAVKATATLELAGPFGDDRHTDDQPQGQGTQ